MNVGVIHKFCIKILVCGCGSRVVSASSVDEYVARTEFLINYRLCFFKTCFFKTVCFYSYSFSAGISDFLGKAFCRIKIDVEKNATIRGEEAVISTPDSKVKVVVIPTDEELMIASDTMALVK